MSGQMDVQSLKIFACVARTGNLSAAGREMGLSPASIYRHINKLEDSLRVRLLNRNTRNMSLTEAGEIYLRTVDRVLSDLDNVHRSLIEGVNNLGGTLHILSRHLVGYTYVSRVLPEFLAEFPDVKVILTLSDAPTDLIEQNVDVLIHSGRVEESALIIRRLASSRRVLCASPEYLEQHGIPNTVEDLINHRCVTYRFDASQPVWRIKRNDEVDSVTISPYIQTNSGMAMRDLLISGAGLGLMPKWAIQHDIDTGRLREVLSDYNISTMDMNWDNTIYLLYPKARYQSKATRQFVTFIAKAFKRRQTAGWKSLKDDGKDKVP